MKNSEWKAQYTHPNWQKKRLEAMEFHGFKCMACGDAESMLHVHHKRYFRDRKVWEYAVEELEVMCDECHGSLHKTKDDIQALIAKMPSFYHEEVLALLTAFYPAWMSEDPFEPGRIEEIRQTSASAFHAGACATLIYTCMHAQWTLDITRKMFDGMEFPDELTRNVESGVRYLQELGAK